MTGTFRLVVARHREDVGWIRQVSKRWHVSLVVKGVDLPNEGREVASFLWAMERFYEDDGWIAFVQADPFDHCPELVKILNTRTLPPKFAWIGDQPVESDEQGGPWHAFPIPVKEWYEDLVGSWEGNVTFAAGGMFALPAQTIRDRFRRHELAALRERVCGDPDGPWVMERLWGAIFS